MAGADWPWSTSTTSLAGLLGACVVAIITGLLIPRWVHSQHVAFWKQRYEDAMKTVDIERQRNDKLVDISEKLLSYAESADRVLRALPSPTAAHKEGSAL